jgi:TPR repeat protein
MRTLRQGRVARRVLPSQRRGGRVPIAVLAFILLGGQAPSPAIVTTPEVWVQPASKAPLAIRIESRDPVPPQAMLLVRGLSSAVQLSEGRMFGPGVWVVPLPSVSRLTVQAPAEISRSDLTLTLVTPDGKPLAEARITLYIAPPTFRDEPVAAVPLNVPNEAEKDAALKLLSKGDESIKAGNVAMAQKFYERAADRGLPEAAMALAGTYDPAELARMNAIGVEPNPALARKWYEKARALGALDADARLRRLR